MSLRSNVGIGIVVGLLMGTVLAATATQILYEGTRPTDPGAPHDLGPGWKKFVAVLSGDHEVPAVDTPAHGEAEFKLIHNGVFVRYEIEVEDIENVVSAHIHLGCAGTTGPPVIWLYPAGGPPAAAPGGGEVEDDLVEGVFTVTSDFLVDLRSGCTYVDVHTDDGVAPQNTGPGDMATGEIRGQIFPKH